MNTQDLLELYEAQVRENERQHRAAMKRWNIEITKVPKVSKSAKHFNDMTDELDTLEMLEHVRRVKHN